MRDLMITYGVLASVWIVLFAIAAKANRRRR